MRKFEIGEHIHITDNRDYYDAVILDVKQLLFLRLYAVQFKEVSYTTGASGYVIRWMTSWRFVKRHKE